MTISVYGIGWLTAAGYGCIGSGVQVSYGPAEGLDTHRQAIFPRPFRNFGRLDDASRMTASVVALALRDAALSPSPTCKQDIGIAGTSREGSLVSDLNYFKDYIENGRTLSRGNLFIYTLPSSPLGEAAIYFGLTGPLFFTNATDYPLSATMALAAEVVAGREADLMLAGQVGGEEALYVVLGPEQQGRSICSLTAVRHIVETESDVAAMVRQFSSFFGKRGSV